MFVRVCASQSLSQSVAICHYKPHTHIIHHHANPFILTRTDTLCPFATTQFFISMFLSIYISNVYSMPLFLSRSSCCFCCPQTQCTKQLCMCTGTFLFLSPFYLLPAMLPPSPVNFPSLSLSMYRYRRCRIGSVTSAFATKRTLVRPRKRRICTRPKRRPAHRHTRWAVVELAEQQRQCYRLVPAKIRWAIRWVAFMMIRTTCITSNSNNISITWVAFPVAEAEEEATEWAATIQAFIPTWVRRDGFRLLRIRFKSFRFFFCK